MKKQATKSAEKKSVAEEMPVLPSRNAQTNNKSNHAAHVSDVVIDVSNIPNGLCKML